MEEQKHILEIEEKNRQLVAEAAYKSREETGKSGAGKKKHKREIGGDADEKSFIDNDEDLDAHDRGIYAQFDVKFDD